MKAIPMYVRQLDPSAFEGSSWAARMDQQYEALIPAGPLPKGSESICVHAGTRTDAIKAAKDRAKKLLAGHGPIRFKVIDNDH